MLPLHRRRFVRLVGCTPFALPGAVSVIDPARAADAAPPAGGRAEHCIFIWLGGGMGQMDTFDPKDLGDNASSPKKSGSLYPSIETAVPGVRVCEHLPRTARLMEQVTVLRSVNHKVID